MRLISLIAGYAAGIAVAMKYRKNSGTSKLPEDVKKSTFNNIVEEVVDIHRDVFDDAKKLFESQFGEVHSLEDLKAKIESVIDTFASEAQTKLDSLKSEWEAKKTEAHAVLESVYNEKVTLLEESKKKALEFAGSALDTVEPWMTQARKKLDAAYKKAKSNKTL
jgi:hypothetical protein